MGIIYELYYLYPTCIASGNHLRTESFIPHTIGKWLHYLLYYLYPAVEQAANIYFYKNSIAESQGNATDFLNHSKIRRTSSYDLTPHLMILLHILFPLEHLQHPVNRVVAEPLHLIIH